MSGAHLNTKQRGLRLHLKASEEMDGLLPRRGRLGVGDE